MSGGEQLIQMANDIGNFFRAEPQREEAIAGIMNHLSKYWTRRMREKLIAQVQHGNQELDDLPGEALKRLMAGTAPTSASASAAAAAAAA
ncbi:MAG: formate dehydrogenase subunit delta, partial [Gammaproteobacteria bacterium]|nr:formate dehydrogenase subunit delta [Gammaproteobacteria bacterium]